MQRLPPELKPLRQRWPAGSLERGILSEEHSKRLGVLPTTRFQPSIRLPSETCANGFETSRGSARRSRPSEEEARLLGLLEPLGLIDSPVARISGRAVRERVKAVAEPGLAGTAVRDAIRAVQAGLLASVVAATSSTTAGSH